MEEKKIIFSGIQPSGTLTLGNYLGAVKNWVDLQDKYNCIYCVADLHAITVRQVPAELRNNSLSLLALLLACGIDPEKNLLFFQSHVSAHAELAWILNCYTMFGELSRMTQFKDKSAKNENNINAGLFTYPSLMAADILLYQTDLVPVGKDQTQHLELARDIATRFNGIYGDVFKIPEGYVAKVGAKVMSLQEPSKKMSKSDENANSYVAILDKKDDVLRKFKRAVTDSETVVRYGENKDGINNLMSIYSAVTSKSFEEIEKEFEGKGYGDFKMAVGEAVDAELAPVREKYEQLMKNKDYLKEIYTKSADTAAYVASKTLSKVYKKVGFMPKR
ncbi:MAG: tryptophan--tRNA ligase [Ruminococcaceae bacterium]|nr:tryptophan--tRNA ligase [Oscillospiraceae bacterium]